MQDKVRNKLTQWQYENEVSWSTSTWLALQAQRLSVAVHLASAWEIATEMQQLAGGVGAAPSSDEGGAATALVRTVLCQKRSKSDSCSESEEDEDDEDEEEEGGG